MNHQFMQPKREGLGWTMQLRFTVVKTARDRGSLWCGLNVTGLLWWHISILILFPLSFGDVGSGGDRSLIVGPRLGGRSAYTPRDTHAFMLHNLLLCFFKSSARIM